MTKGPFERALVRKGKRALKVARLALDAGDNDSAVSRSYYAMFDIAQAALLRAGVTEDKLPRTHGGVIEAFRRHAVQTGQIDRQLATNILKRCNAVGKSLIESNTNRTGTSMARTRNDLRTQD